MNEKKQISLLLENINKNRSDTQKRILNDLYNGELEPRKKISKLEEKLSEGGEITSTATFSFDDSSMDISSFELLLIKTMEDRYLERAGALFVKRA